MQHWQLPFLGLAELPAELTEFEIRYFFTFPAREREAIFTRRGDHHRLGGCPRKNLSGLSDHRCHARDIEVIMPSPLGHHSATATRGDQA